MYKPNKWKVFSGLILLIFLSFTSFCIAQERNGKKKKKGSNTVVIPINSSKKNKISSNRDLSFTWISPKKEKINLSGDKVEIELIVQSENSFDPKDLILYHNNKKVIEKADEVKFSQMTQSKYRFKARVELFEGENKLQVKLNNSSSLPKFLKKEGSTVTEVSQSGIEGKEGVYWISPVWNSNPIASDKRNFQMKVKINSTVSFKKEDIYVVVHGFKKVLPAADSKLKQISSGSYEFTNSFQLDKEGLIKIKVHVNPGSHANIKKTLESELLILNFDPVKPNMHLLSIGTETNLEFTVQDARDFAMLFANQGAGNRQNLFNTVEIDTLLGKEATADKITKRIEIIGAKFHEGIIQEKDIIVLYLSSHGFLVSEKPSDNAPEGVKKLRIMGNDYNYRTPNSTSVSYDEDIIGVLDRIPCKKLIFIDACYSGGAKDNGEEVDSVRYRLNKLLKGTTTIVSSKGDEASYEDVAWSNGAFTEAIIEGLRDGKADSGNRDGWITINELRNYISFRVPKLVSKIKGKTQNPRVIRDDLGDMAIFKLD